MKTPGLAGRWAWSKIRIKLVKSDALNRLARRLPLLVEGLRWLGGKVLESTTRNACGRYRHCPEKKVEKGVLLVPNRDTAWERVNGA